MMGSSKEAAEPCSATLRPPQQLAGIRPLRRHMLVRSLGAGHLGMTGESKAATFEFVASFSVEKTISVHARNTRLVTRNGRQYSEHGSVTVEKNKRSSGNLHLGVDIPIRFRLVFPNLDPSDLDLRFPEIRGVDFSDGGGLPRPRRARAPRPWWVRG